MSLLDDIPVTVETLPRATQSVGNAVPILHEIDHALLRLLESNEPTIIDLRAIPFGPGDEDRLLSALGKGEVVATLNAMGETIVTETRYQGVWLVDHRNPEGERIALQIEIARIPDILCAREDDISDSLGRLGEALTSDE